MKITFCGAAKQVTGSMHLLTLDSGYNILLDCGLDYEQKKNFHYSPPNSFPFDPLTIDAVILSHAHIDHSGNLPNLVRQGYGGPIYCTEATAELSYHLLLDSAKIQDHDFRKNKKKKIKTPKPLYTENHVKETANRFKTIPFHKEFKLNEQVSFEFGVAGHLLGAAFIKVNIKEEKQKTIVFTGDWGRRSAPLLLNPEPLPAYDVLISESTYGNRAHRKNVDIEQELLTYINHTCVENRGKLIIPAFSVGRTQAIIYTINKLVKKGLMPDVKVYVDSPLAIKGTNIYSSFRSILNEEASSLAQKFSDLFYFDNLKLIEDKNDTAMADQFFEPCVIVSAAGMVEGGRIQTHIANHISNPYATVLIAGFCSPGTFGYELLQGKQRVTIKGKEQIVHAKVTYTDAFSSHADGEELCEMITQAYQPNSTVCLVHGDDDNMLGLKEKLEKNNIKHIFIPDKEDTFVL